MILIRLIMLYLRSLLFLSSLSIILSSCQTNNQYSNLKESLDYSYLSKDDPGNHRYQGHYKLGRAYHVKGEKYTPRAVLRYSRNGLASWYGARYNFHGKKTANGDIFNKEMLTAAHKTLPLPSLVKVTNQKNGRSIIVLVNDRGPFVRNREIDLSERAAEKLGIRQQGVAPVNVRYLHQETQAFLKLLGLEARTNSRAKHKLANKQCTVNCHIKLVNLKYKFLH